MPLRPWSDASADVTPTRLQATERYHPRLAAQVTADRAGSMPWRSSLSRLSMRGCRSSRIRRHPRATVYGRWSNSRAAPWAAEGDGRAPGRGQPAPCRATEDPAGRVRQPSGARRRCRHHPPAIRAAVLKKNWSVSNFQWFGFLSESPDRMSRSRDVGRVAPEDLREPVEVGGATLFLTTLT